MSNYRVIKVGNKFYPQFRMTMIAGKFIHEWQYFSDLHGNSLHFDNEKDALDACLKDSLTEKIHVCGEYNIIDGKIIND